MLSFLIPNVKLGIPEEKEYNFSSSELGLYLKALEENLCKAKCLLDEPFKNKLYSKTTYLFESFNCEKETVTQLSNNFNITNAWIKGYELIDHFNLIPDNLSKLIHFDNAAFPGSFILAAHHYTSTMRNLKYEWYASSLAQDTDNIKGHLEDTYDLCKNYPKNWLMSDNNNGDVTNPQNLLNFQELLPLVDLYTSDLGFDVSYNYNAQEKLHLTAHYGQLLCGLMVLKPGGNLFIKQFTLFEETNICNIAILTNFFETVYISKPATSKPDNSEIYIVGKNFRISNPVIIPHMLKILNKAYESNSEVGTLYDIMSFSNEFINCIKHINETLVKIQSDKIIMNINSFEEVLRQMKKTKGSPYKIARSLFDNVRNKELKEWYLKYKIKKIHAKNRLKMKDAFKQQSKNIIKNKR